MKVAEHCETMQPLMDEYQGVKGFHEHYPIFRQVSDVQAKRKNEFVGAITSIKKHEPGLLEHCIQPNMSRMLVTFQAIVDIQYVLRRMDVQNASLFLNQFALGRIATLNRSKDRFVNAQDWARMKLVCKDLCKFAESNIFPKGEPSHVSRARSAELKAMLKDADLDREDLQPSY